MPVQDQLFHLVNTFEKDPGDAIRQQIIDFIRDLINNNFAALVELLYRIDIDEKKLRQLLQSHADTDAALIIADCVISRQLQKTATRNQYANRNKPTGDDSW